jgi:hypothetical protein
VREYAKLAVTLSELCESSSKELYNIELGRTRAAYSRVQEANLRLADHRRRHGC